MLADQVGYTPPPVVTLEAALEQAYQSRSDYRSASALVSAAESSKRAAEAERLPAFQFDGNFGDIGRSPVDSHGTSWQLYPSIFRYSKLAGHEPTFCRPTPCSSNAGPSSHDLRSGVEQDVRTAFLDLKASGDEVNVARSAVDLASEQLKQSEDRFTAGVTNNVEVVQSQEAIATANDNYISALFSYNLAKASLARALGGAEKTYLQFLGGGH